MRFAPLAAALPRRGALRAAITAARRRPEPECVPPLLPLAQLPPEQDRAVGDLARRLVAGLRHRDTGVARENLVQLHWFGDIHNLDQPQPPSEKPFG